MNNQWCFHHYETLSSRLLMSNEVRYFDHIACYYFNKAYVSR